MGNVISATIGKIATLLGFDGTDFHPLATDTTGQVKALIGYDGADYHLIKTDADGRPEIKVSGQVPDADTVDGMHATDFVAVAGDTMTGALTLPGAPTVDLHASTKKYVDDAVAGAACPAADCTVWMPDAPPASADALDDEFADASFSNQWTVFDANALLTPTEDEAGLQVAMATRAGSNLAGYYKTAPAGGYHIYAKLGLHGFTNPSMPALALWENPASGAGDILSFGFRLTGTGIAGLYVYRWSDFNTINSTLASVATHWVENGMYLRLRYSAGDCRCEYSSDGVGWYNLYYTAALWMTPTALGLGFINNNSGGTMVCRAQFCRVRRAQGTTSILYGDRVKLWRA